MLWYLPLEIYDERYTCYLSSPNGFWETFLKENKIQYKALRPWDGQTRGLAGHGAVLDTVNRCHWSMKQISMFLMALDRGEVKDGDVVYLEDFWAPGFESLPYARDMYKVKFKIYAWCHAQSVDPSDFTSINGMAPWMRYFEQGIAKSLDGIFVADVGLKEMLLKPPMYPPNVENAVIDETGDCQPYSDLPVNQCPIHAVGTCWSTDWIREEYMYEPFEDRTKTVIFASRWDKEKNPDFYMDLVSAISQERSDINFVVTTGFGKLSSNVSSLAHRAWVLADKLKNFSIMVGTNKKDYMKLLNTVRVHFNCADHDWVSYALLESCAMGCMPLFPNHKGFPLALHYDLDHLYKHLDLEDAKKKLYALIDGPQRNMEHVFRRFDNAIPYVANIMGL